MENNTQLTVGMLNNNISTLTKIALINLPDGTSMEKAGKIVMKEIINFEMVCMMKPELANLDKDSIFLAVRNAIADNISLSPNAGLVYLYPGKVCTGVVNNVKVYKDILIYQPTCEGELSIARQSGAILDHKRPVVNFDGKGDVDTVIFEFMVPAYPKPRWESVTFNKTFFEKLKQKSAAKFGGTANANYTSWNQKDNGNGVMIGTIDPEFAASKAIKHGLKKRGRNANENQHPVQQVEKTVNTENTEDEVTNLKNQNQQNQQTTENNNTIQDVKFEEIPATPVTEEKTTETESEEELF